MNDTASFAALGLSAACLEQLQKLDFVEPTPIQQQAIPLLLQGCDLVGIAQTGTGKTGAFGIPMIELFTQTPPPAPKAVEEAAEHNQPTQINVTPVRGLVLAPTRELALQTSTALQAFGANTSLRVVTVYGGAPYKPQLRALREGAEIVVGTPGRLIDLLERGALNLSRAEMVVLDEADEMLKMGFTEDVETILEQVPEQRLTALFSATMPAAIEKVARKYLQDPQQVAVSAPSTTVDTIRQMYAVVPSRYRFEALCRILWTRQWTAAIVFVKTRQDAEELAIHLSGRGILAAGISGDVAQRDRERLIQSLREGTLNVLVATDVAARGIDVDRVELVVNYEAPREPESYVHRIGRTGRAGRQGSAITLFTGDERHRLRRIERLTGTPMEYIEIPDSAELLRERAQGVVSTLPQVHSPQTLEALEKAVREQLAQESQKALEAEAPELDWQKLALRALWVLSLRGSGTERDLRLADQAFAEAEFPKGGRGKSGAKLAREQARKRERKGFDTVENMVRYRLEVGRSHGVNPRSIVGSIAGEADIPGNAIGHIKIFPSFTLVEIDRELDSTQLEAVGRATVRGRCLRISPDQGPKSAKGAASKGHTKGNYQGKPVREDYHDQSQTSRGKPLAGKNRQQVGKYKQQTGKGRQQVGKFSTGKSGYNKPPRRKGSWR